MSFFEDIQNFGELSKPITKTREKKKFNLYLQTLEVVSIESQTSNCIDIYIYFLLVIYNYSF